MSCEAPSSPGLTLAISLHILADYQQYRVVVSLVTTLLFLPTVATGCPS